MSFFGTKDYWLNVQQGNDPGSTMLGKVVVDPAAGPAVKDMWGGSANLIYPTAAETWEIVSLSANDTLLGTGARTVLINYLDDNYVEQFKIIEMDGLTPVALNADHFRPNGALVLSSGSLQTNDDDIVIQVSGGGNPRQYIIAGKSASQDTHYTVPAGKTAYIIQTYGWYPKGDDGFQVSNFMFFGSNTWLTSAQIPVYQSGYNINILARVALPEKTDLRFTAFSTNVGVEATSIQEFIVVDTGTFMAKGFL